MKNPRSIFLLAILALYTCISVATTNDIFFTDSNLTVPCLGDFEPDGDVDRSDLAVFSGDFGRANCAEAPLCRADFDKDSDVDGSDLAPFSAEFGRTDCPVPLPIATEIAEEHARVVWGDQISSGTPFLLHDEEGNPFSYVFPITIGGTEFPGYPEVFDAVRVAGEQYSRSDDRFYAELENIIGQSGSVEVAVSRHDFPVLVVRHSLHPYFLYAKLAADEARNRLGDSLQFERMIYKGPHEMYFQFRVERRMLELHAFLLKTSEEISPIPFLEHEAPQESAVLHGDEITKQVWQQLSQDQQTTETTRAHTVKWLNHYKSVPVVNWTHWCVPTAATMTAGFWDHYVPPSTFTGYGRVIDYWFDHQPICQNSNVTNVPNFIDEVIDHNTPTCTWSSVGFLGAINSINQYNFTWNNTKGTVNNDWGWPLIVQEIDSDRPAVWGVGPNSPHAMTAIGYRISGSQKFVIVYNTWGASAKEQLAEYSYDQWSGGANTKTGVGRLQPGGGSNPDHAVLGFPRGDEVVFGTTDIKWFVWGDKIKWTSIFVSKDGGNTWNLITEFPVPAQTGWNTFSYNFTDITSKGRVKIINYSSSFGLPVANDGSPKNFFVQAKADLVPIPTCQLDSSGRLKVRVENRGTVTAQASSTRVEFFPGGVFILNTPSISPSGSAEMPLDIPSQCWNSDCDYEIKVDFGNQVDEANEGNNSASGACFG